MFDKLEELERSYAELTQKLSEPGVLDDRETYRELTQRFSELQPIVEARREHNRIQRALDEARELASSEDPEFAELAQEEVTQLQTALSDVESHLKTLLLPKDPNDERNVLLEIRAGTGGSEATLFAAELYRMYSRYAERQGWRLNPISLHETDVGGVKEVVAAVEGQRVYSRLRFESGVHRVQRVPVTESSGRIHTSAVTVAVLPEPAEIEVDIDEKDLRIDRFCSSGPGGQSVNTTYSAIRITHLPTGLVVSCQDEKSQHKNKAQALRVLRSRLYDVAEREQHEARASERRDMVRSGDRSEKIRTYNFPQGRVTDHRIHLTSHRLSEILGGDLDVVVDALVAHYQTQKLQSDVVH